MRVSPSCPHAVLPIWELRKQNSSTRICNCLNGFHSYICYFIYHLSDIMWVDDAYRWCHGYFCGITVTGGGGDWTYNYIWECLYNPGHNKCGAFGKANEVYFIYGILNLWVILCIIR